jgi:hypothetical protein
MYFNEEHKLLYCAVPKVACTEFMRLFFRLEGRNRDTAWRDDPHFKAVKPLFSELSAEPRRTGRITKDTVTDGDPRRRGDCLPPRQYGLLQARSTRLRSSTTRNGRRWSSFEILRRGS